MNPTLVSWSSGKDAAMTLYQLCQKKAQIAGLFTVIDKRSQTVAMHHIPKTLVELQAKSLQLPVHFIEVDWPCSNQVYEATMQSAFNHFAEMGIKSIAYGDLFLNDIKNYRENLHHGSAISATFPLWHQPTEILAKSFIEKDFKAILVCVDTNQMDASFLGKPFSLWPQTEFDPCGENGEFHSFCWDGPNFSFPIPFERQAMFSHDHFQYLALIPQRSP